MDGRLQTFAAVTILCLLVFGFFFVPNHRMIVLGGMFVYGLVLRGAGVSYTGYGLKLNLREQAEPRPLAEPLVTEAPMALPMPEPPSRDVWNRQQWL
jgi:hypothetical protein